MDKIVFAPEIDVPLSGLTVIGFVLHFNSWAQGDSADTTVDLKSRLSAARFRVVLLFAGLVFFCWMTNIALWAVFGLLLGLGVVVALIAGGDAAGSGIFLLFAAYIIREWSFGFPQLILQPPPDINRTTQNSDSQSDLLGVHGTVVSPLRPSGDAELDGRVVPVVSDSGQLLDVGTDIIVSGTRNGRICVQPMDAVCENDG